MKAVFVARPCSSHHAFRLTCVASQVAGDVQVHGLLAAVLAVVRVLAPAAREAHQLAGRAEHQLVGERLATVTALALKAIG